MNQISGQIILEIIIIIIGLYLAFFKSYFQEKGKNVATSEDIKEITSKIETVKSDINLLTHKRISIATEKQKALLDFHSKYYSWLNYVIHASVAVSPEYSDAHVIKVNENLEKMYSEILLSEATLEVFYDGDSDLLDHKTTLKIDTLKIAGLLTLTLIDVNTQCQKILMCEKLEDYDYRTKELAKYNAIKLDIIKKFHAERLEKYKPIALSSSEFIKKIKLRIDKLAE